MNDLISLEAAWEAIKNVPLIDPDRMAFKLQQALWDVPTVDAVPVVHGEWVRDHVDHGKLICSRCKCKAGYRAKETELGYNIFIVSPSNYCPNCGAKMNQNNKED